MNNAVHEYAVALETALRGKNGMMLTCMLNPYYSRAPGNFEARILQSDIESIDHRWRRIAVLHASVENFTAKYQYEFAFERQKRLLKCVTFHHIYICVWLIYIGYREFLGYFVTQDEWVLPALFTILWVMVGLAQKVRLTINECLDRDTNKTGRPYPRENWI